MARNRTPGSRPGLILCDRCGEEYAASYRRCPFCDDFEEEYEDNSPPPSRTGGKRLANRRGGGYRRITPMKVLGVILSLAVLAAAAWFVVTRVLPAIHRGNTDTLDSNGVSESAPPSGVPGATASDAGSSGPETSPDVSEPVDGVGAVGFTLDLTDVTLAADEHWRPVVTFTPEGSTGQLTWTSDDPTIATVSADGEIVNVNAGSEQVRTTVTATLPNGISHSVIVRCDGGSGQDEPGVEPSTSPSTAPSTAPSAAPTSAPSTTYKISKSDFTFSRSGEQTTLWVVGYEGTVTWSSSDPGIVSVDSDGVCRAVGTGSKKCTITGTLEDGTYVTAIARIKI